MAELKTQKSKASVTAYLDSLSEPEQKKDAKILLKMMREATGEKPVLWGDAIVGFGEYHYESERSAQKGDWMLTAFSPRKQNLVVYIMPGVKNYPALTSKLGKFKTGVSCLYIKRLSDVDTVVLQKLITKAYLDMKKLYAKKG